MWLFNQRSISGISAGWWTTATLLGVLAALATWFYHDSLFLGPAHHHSWAQADWLALAYRFRADGFDFFHPATYNLMTPAGQTPAGFPVPPYLAAGLMALTGSGAPGLMRLLTLLLGTGGLLALAGLVRRAALATGRVTPTGAAARGALAALLVACSPLYVYYQAGFQPSVPALAAALGGYYCFWRARTAVAPGAARRWLALAVGLLALAGAIRTPLALPWLLVGGHLLLEGPRTARRYGKALVGGLYAGTAAWLAGYFLYNEYLAALYGGAMFLARPLPPGSWAELVKIWAEVVPKWGLALLSAPQWLALAALLAVVAGQGARLGRTWLIHGILLTGGGLVYAGLMSPQLLDHDYYFIDALLLPLALAAGAALAVVRVGGGAAGAYRAARLAGLLLLVGGWAWAARAEQDRRYTTRPGDRSELTRANFAGSARWLDSLGVAPTARLLVVDAYSFNLPLLLANRRGWTVLTTSEEDLRAGLAQPAQYVITQDTFFRSDAVASYPLLTEQLTRVAGNGRLTLWRPHPLPAPRWTAHTDLETPPDPVRWQNGATLTTAGPARSGRTASALLLPEAYSVGFMGAVGALDLRPGDHLLARCFVWFPPDGPAPELKLVVSIENAAGVAYSWQALPLTRVSHSAGRWNALGSTFTVPPLQTPTDVLRVYVLKGGATAAYVDDFDLAVVRP